MSIRSQFRQLCAKAHAADMGGTGSCSDFEPHLVILLQFAREHLDTEREELVSCFILVAQGRIPAPPETLPFCMHTLRLPEVLQSLCEWRDSAPRDSREYIDRAQYLRDVEMSYQEDWEDAELWMYYEPERT